MDGWQFAEPTAENELGLASIVFGDVLAQAVLVVGMDTTTIEVENKSFEMLTPVYLAPYELRSRDQILRSSSGVEILGHLMPKIHDYETEILNPRPKAFHAAVDIFGTLLVAYHKHIVRTTTEAGAVVNLRNAMHSVAFRYGVDINEVAAQYPNAVKMLEPVVASEHIQHPKTLSGLEFFLNSHTHYRSH